uniref:FxLYD domain-containing protein n=1 Tax=Streptomyces sp. NBC_00049 TaxID=2903617 RepID=A0AAU2K1K6_9ACTN
MSDQEPSPGWGQPQQPGGSWGQPPPAPRRSTGKIIGWSCLGAVVLVLLLLVGGLLIGGEVVEEPDGRDPSRPAGQTRTQGSGPAGDVKITACEVSSTTNWASAELLIDNRSSKSSDYVVQVEFVNAAGKRLGDAFASADRLAAGQSAAVTAQGLDQITQKVTCRIVKVTRFAS